MCVHVYMLVCVHVCLALAMWWRRSALELVLQVNKRVAYAYTSCYPSILFMLPCIHFSIQAIVQDHTILLSCHVAHLVKIPLLLVGYSASHVQLGEYVTWGDKHWWCVRACVHACMCVCFIYDDIWYLLLLAFTWHMHTRYNCMYSIIFSSVSRCIFTWVVCWCSTSHMGCQRLDPPL